jgi:hypothetical protein
MNSVIDEQRVSSFVAQSTSRSGGNRLAIAYIVYILGMNCGETQSLGRSFSVQTLDGLYGLLRKNLRDFRRLAQQHDEHDVDIAKP